MKQESFYCARYYVTYRCNSRCTYCNVWQNSSYRSEELSLGEAKELVAQLWQKGVRYIDFTGGEPTLCEYLEELMLYARALGIKTEFTTNGVCHTPRSRKRLLGLAQAADKCNVSLDTLDPAVYRRLRGIDGCESAMRSILEIAAVRPLKIMTVVTEENIGELDQLIHFSQEAGASLYLSPVFRYFEQNGTYRETPYVRQILEKTYEANTVVFLHFMKFFSESGADSLPPCSANGRTLTLAPDGSLMLPCYHAYRERVPWEGNLEGAVGSALFEQYLGESGRLECCLGCTVIPYMGISFSYEPDRYFLLASYSEKLNHLKRDFTDELKDRIHVDQGMLLGQMEEMMELAWSLNGRFAGPLLEGTDCWQLKNTPHCYFDRINGTVYPCLREAYREGRLSEEDYLAIFEHAMEFQLRLWKFYISTYMDTARKINTQAEKAWLARYLEELFSGVEKAAGEARVREALLTVTGLLDEDGKKEEL